MIEFLSRPPVDRIAFWGISWYALLIVLGIVIGLWITTREERRLGLPEDTAIDFFLVAIPFGVIGARLYSVIFRWSDYVDDWTRIFNLREGGLAILGAVLGGLAAAWLVSRRKKISFLRLCDMAVPALILAQAIGRWGNYFNLEAFGLPLPDTARAWTFFPIAIEIPVEGQWVWHMATFFYEFVWDLLVFWALMWTRRRVSPPSKPALADRSFAKNGDMFCWYLLLYGAGRTVIEGLRGDSLTVYNIFVRISQILCALACVCVVIYFCMRQRFVRRRRGATAHDVLVIVSSVLALATCFLGEFERNAYGELFALAQLMLGALLLFGIAMLILRIVGRVPFHPLHIVLLLFCVAIGTVLVAGVGRRDLDNTFYVSVRQLICTLDWVMCGALCYYVPFPPLVKEARRARRQAERTRSIVIEDVQGGTNAQPDDDDGSI